MIKVTVIVPVYNNEQTIIDCVESILRNNYKSLEVIVVNDASTDSTSDLLEQIQNLGIKVINNPINIGVSATRNRGLENSTGDIVFFTDADCIVRADWIHSGLKHFEETDIVGVEGRILYSKRNLSYIYKIPCNPFYHRRYVRTINQPNQDFAGGNIAFRRKTLLQVNGFDSLKYRDGREDTDLGWRIRELGKIVHSPDMTVVHTGSMWTLKELLRSSRRYQKDVTFLKHHGFFFFKQGCVLHPQFLLMLVFPPLLFKTYCVRTKAEFKFALGFYLYLICVRWHIWSGAIKTRKFVI